MGGKGSGRKSTRKPCTTNYALGWQQYKLSDSYKRSHFALLSKGMIQPHIDNTLSSAFEAGWTATGTKIQIIELPKTQQGG